MRFAKISRCVLFCLLLTLAAAHAQDDGLNLPSELYVLANDGIVTRYGLGAAGIAAVTPADTFVVDFAVAPDGNTLAYRSEAGLALKTLFASETRALDTEASLPQLRGRGATLAWTAQGDALAYATVFGARVYFPALETFTNVTQANVISLLWSPDGGYLALEAQNIDPAAASSYWWIYRRVASTLTLVSALPSSVGAAWLDNARLVFAPESGGLFAMDMSAGNAQTQLLDASQRYLLPAVRDDGTVIAFVAATAPAEATPIPNEEAVLGRLVALANGTLVETGSGVIDIDRVNWAPRAELLIAFRGGVLALVNPVNGTAFALPMSGAVAYAWGPPPPASAAGLELPADGFFLSDFATGLTQLWRVPADGNAAAPFTQAENPITEFAVAPDGRSVAFVSGGALWWQNVSDPEGLRRLTELTDSENIAPAFNADGQTIAYVDSGGVYEIAISGGEPALRLAHPAEGRYERPLYAPNVNLMLLTLHEGESISDYVLDLNTGELTLAYQIFRQRFWLADGRVIAFDGAAAGALLFNPLDLAQTTTLAALPGAVLTAAQSGENLRVIVADGLLARGQILDLPLNGAAASRTGDTGFIVAPLLSPRGGFVAGYRYQRLDDSGVLRGPLLFVDIASGAHTLLSVPSEAWDFQWGR
ncbi:MAG: PD40 domain-containing protein [Chloroflexi bacterium]|nr:PD40 domain-containing protein [Chloroflexota bacterium]